jgi:hypothetical protein
MGAPAKFWILEIKDRDPYIVMPEIADQKKSDEDVLRPSAHVEGSGV